MYLDDLVVGVVVVWKLSAVLAQCYIAGGQFRRQVMAHLVPIHHGVFKHGRGGRAYGVRRGVHDVSVSERVVGERARDGRAGSTSHHRLRG